MAQQSRDVNVAVEWPDFYGGLKEALLDDRIPRLMHMAVQTRPLCLAHSSARSACGLLKQKQIQNSFSRVHTWT